MLAESRTLEVVDDKIRRCLDHEPEPSALPAPDRILRVRPAPQGGARAHLCAASGRRRQRHPEPDLIRRRRPGAAVTEGLEGR